MEKAASAGNQEYMASGFLGSGLYVYARFYLFLPHILVGPQVDRVVQNWYCGIESLESWVSVVEEGFGSCRLWFRSLDGFKA